MVSEIFLPLSPTPSLRDPLKQKAAKLFRPEDVCALESMVSAWAHLSDVGVDTLNSHDAVAKFLLKIKKRHDSLLAQVRGLVVVALVGGVLILLVVFVFGMRRVDLMAFEIRRAYSYLGAGIALGTPSVALLFRAELGSRTPSPPPCLAAATLCP